MDEHTRLEIAIAHLESQRENLGDAVVDSALKPLQEKVAGIEARGDFPDLQRKQVTILFTDIVGSTKVTSHLDPEDTRDIFDNALQRLAKPVEGHNGHVTRFMGDGFKAVFGTPQAHENDPEQAVRAGLGILEAAQDLALELEEQWQIQDFQVRIGINTGLVAVGGSTEAEDTLMGSPVNLAARLESAAPSGGLLMSHNTYKHVRGVFNIQPQVSIHAKGFDQPVPVYEVLQVKERPFRTYLHDVEGIETRMVGRESELTTLQEVFYKAFEGGEGGVVTVHGEAGVGKSRLVFEFQNWLELLPPPLIYFFLGRGRQSTQQQPFNLLRDVFAFRFEIHDSDPNEIVHNKIETGFGEIFGADQAGQLRAHFIGQLLGFDFSDSPYLKGILEDHQQLRDRASAYIEDYFQLLTDQSTAVIVLEDIHWADDSSLDLIDHIGSRTPQQPLLIVCLARRTLLERHSQWGADQQYHSHLEISPLSNPDSRLLVDEILQKVDQVPAALRELIISNTEGNPFYIEELVKMLIETDVIFTRGDTWQIELDRLAKIEVPDTLTGVLQSRLDSLPTFERRILQIAAVMGKDFWDDAVEWIRQASGQIEDGELPNQMVDSLASLQQRELIHFREESTFIGTREYSFKHILFRDVAYETTVKSVRRVYHGLTADWLAEVTQQGDRSEEYAAVIADNYLLAEQSDQASDWYFRAGLHAKSQVAMKEARNYLTQALELLPPDDLENRWRVLIERDEILGILGDIEGRKSDDQALISMAQEMEDDNKLALAYYRLGYFYNSQGQYKNELDAYEKAISAARKVGDRIMKTQILGLKVVCLTFLGEMEAAQETADSVLSSARELKDDNTLAKTLGNLVIFYQSVDISKAVELVQESIELLDRLGEHNLKATSLLNLGYIYTQAGYYEQGDQTFKQSLNLSIDLENPRLIAYNQLNLGLTYFRLKDYQMAREYLEKTLIDTVQINDTFAHAACQSYLGLVSEEDGDFELAEKNFEDAWKTFIEIGAPGYAMDALSGIARCALGTGKLEQARKHSQEICDYLEENGSQGMEFPILAYLTCAEIFQEGGETDNMLQAIAAGNHQLMDRANKISDLTWRKRYFEAVPEHQAMIEMREKIRINPKRSVNK